jgi:glycosyltransferase involved in cell wall biosynthesis
MKVFYDHQIFSYQRFGGVSRYFAEIMKEFRKDPDVRFDLGVRYTGNEYLRDSGLAELKELPGPVKSHEKLSQLFSFVANKGRCNYFLRHNEYDIIHPTFYDPYFFRYKKKAKIVVTVYDMTPEKFPELFKSNTLYNKFVTQKWIAEKKRIALRADHVVAISENTKKDVVDIFGISPDKVQVIYLSNSLYPGSASGAGDPVGGEYFLFVGARNHYKNFLFVLSVFQEIKREEKNLYLLCAGGGRFTEEERAVLRDLDLTDSVVQTSVSDQGLASLYQKAAAFIYPSLYEGFGIPILEAFACGCPAVLSNTSCFPEIAGNAALYFDPRDEESLLKSLRSVYHDKEKREELVRAGGKREKDFSWKKTAEETKKLYASLL